MEMKDKLTRNYHDTVSYKMRKVLFCFSLCFTASIVVSIPTYISVKNYNESLALEAREKSEKNDEKETEQLTYQDQIE